MDNTSGQGKYSSVPSEIQTWNWGAFFLNVLWGLFNRTYIALLCVIPVFGVLMAFVLGFKGNEWAWQNKRWKSVEQFQHEQKIWSTLGIRLAKIILFLAILGYILNPFKNLIKSLYYQ